MPTKEQRRATARRKLQRQLERREQKAKRRRTLTIAGISTVVVAAIAAVVVVFVLNKDSDSTPTASASTTSAASPAPDLANVAQLPAFKPLSAPGENCQYPATPDPAAKKVNPPRAGKVPTDEKQVSVSMTTNQGNIGIQLDNEKAPCTVNSFASLANQGFFNDTPCLRLTSAPRLSVLQCGFVSPTDRSGGPGYQFADEYPTNQYPPNDPALSTDVVYPRGTLAMANAGPATNSAQFFMVYKDSVLPPGYTVFGKIDETGLATLDKIAAGGIKTGQDGDPNLPVQIKTVQVD